MITEYFTNLPLSEVALSVNDVQIEKEIIGFKTSYVTGREPISSQLIENEIGISDGSRYRYKKDKTRDIVVTYHLVADTLEIHKRLENKLKSLIYEENSKWIFEDEKDVFFTGTVSDFTGSKLAVSGLIASAGEITIHCSDPYRYSVKEYEIEPSADDGKTILIDYKGTYKAYPILEATMINDNGFIGYVNDRESILQFGSPDEVDGKSYQKSETLVTLVDFINASDDVNGKDVMHPTYGCKGTLTTGTWFGTNFLKFGSKGSTVGSANGGLRTINVPADSNGVVGAKNFYSYIHLLFYAGLMGQTGEMCINYLTSDNKMIAGINWYKTDASGNAAKYELWANGKLLQVYNYTTSHLNSQNPWYWSWGHCDLKKEGGKLTFYWWGNYPSYYIPEVENMECAKIQISIKQWGDRSGNRFMTYAGFDQFTFQKMNVDAWDDVPNKFGKSDILSVNCRSGEVTNRGLPAIDLGAIGNNWEDFYLKPGNNQIRCIYSEWAKQPRFKLKYREVFL